MGILFHIWQPLIAIFAFPAPMTRKDLYHWTHLSSGDEASLPMTITYSTIDMDYCH